jgi:hypothetical protein
MIPTKNGVKMTNIELHSEQPRIPVEPKPLDSTGTPRLLDSEAKAIWFNQIYQDVASGRIDSKVGVASVNHAESVGYILPSDRTEFVSQLYPFAKKSISAGYVVLVGDESNYNSIRKMMGFAVLCSPANVPKYNEFMLLLNNPPDDLTLPMLMWKVEVWVAGIVSSLYNLELGWKDGHLVVDVGF